MLIRVNFVVSNMFADRPKHRLLACVSPPGELNLSVLPITVTCIAFRLCKKLQRAETEVCKVPYMEVHIQRFHW